MNNGVPTEVLFRFSTQIVASYQSRNPVQPGDVFPLIQEVLGSLDKLGSPIKLDVSRASTVPMKRSVFPRYIVCLEDGKRMKVLTRHLKLNYGLTPDQYRAKWGLPDSYPVVAPKTSAQLSAKAKETGLGRNPARPTNLGLIISV